MSAGSKKTATTQRQLVDKIYAAALDPAGYVNIVQAWDAHYEALRDAQADDQAEDFDWAKEFFVHFQRAGEIFERLSSNSAISVADRAGAMAKSAFVVEGSGRITFANPQAVDELGVLQGRFLDDLAFDQPSRVAMRDLLKGVQSGLEKSLADRKALRLVQDGMDEPTIFVGGIVDDPQSGQQVLFVWSANHHWHEAVRGILSNSFGLTDAELELVKRLQLGGTIKDISAETGRSQATLRTQLSATLSKMNLKSQVALARTITGLVTSLSRESAVLPDIASKQFKATTANQRSYTIDISGDRRVQIVESGDLAGQPFYFIQTTTWPTLTEEIVTRCADHGIRIVSPYRSGVGDTTKLSIKMNLRELAAYHQEILARLGIGRVLVGGQCSGGIYALELARALQGNCAGVVLVDTGAPLQNVGMINQMPLAPRRLFLAARFFPLALRTPYKMAHTDFYSGQMARRVVCNTSLMVHPTMNNRSRIK